MKRILFVAELALGTLLFVTASFALHTQLVGTEGTEEKISKVLVLLGLLVGTTGLGKMISAFRVSKGIQKIHESTSEIAIPLLQEVKEKEIAIENHIQALTLTKTLMGAGEIEMAAINLVDSCDLDGRIRATAQFVFKGGLKDVYYRSITSRLKQAVDSHRTLSYQVIVSERGSEEANIRRNAFFKEADVESRFKIRTLKKSQPFDILLAGGNMILALSGHNEERYNLGFLITDPGSVTVTDKWFEEVLWESATPLKDTAKLPADVAESPHE